MRKVVSMLSLALTLVGCSVYHPQAVDIPLINHAGDARVDASFALSTFIVPDVFTTNVTASYGFNNWFAGQLHFNFGGDNYYAQLAPGYYYPLGEKSVVECYAGCGYGGAARDNVDPDNSDNATNKYNFNGHFWLPFVQGNIGWHDLTKANIDLAFGLKVGGFLSDYNYRELDGNGNEIPTKTFDYNKSNLLLEPQVMLRMGTNRLKFNVRGGFAWLSDLYQSSYNFVYDYLTVSAGVTFCF